MATVGDLKKALLDLLSRHGALARIEAHTKMEIFSTLDKMKPTLTPPSDVEVDEATCIINELILEYMKFNDLQFSESVFRSEIKHNFDPMSRRLLCQTLNVKPTVLVQASSCEDNGGPEKPVPLLYYFVEHFRSTKPGRD